MVYLDYNASTPVDPRVRDEVLRVLSDVPGNPSSVHMTGRRAADTIEAARARVAALMGTGERDVVFTSGASEAAVISIIGLMLGANPRRPDVLVGATEHKAVLSAAETGARLTGGRCRLVKVLSDGRLDEDDLRSALAEYQPSAVAVMAANNETGALNDLGSRGPAVRSAGAVFVSDLTQAVGKAEVDATEVDVGFLSSHKIYGPQGVGALVADRHARKQMVSVLSAGGQEHGLRGGTLPTASIAGFGLAAELTTKEWRQDIEIEEALAKLMITELRERVPGVTLNGPVERRLANTLNLRFAGADGEAVMASMPDIEVSAGSACNAANPVPSHVLAAMGLTRVEASESLRISLGRPTDTADIEYAIDRIDQAVSRVRALSREGS